MRLFYSPSLSLYTLITLITSTIADTLIVNQANTSNPSSRLQTLPSAFKPPQVFQHNNLVRDINLDKSYVRETVNVVVENVDANDQTGYYFPIQTELLGTVGGFEARDKKDEIGKTFAVDTFVVGASENGKER